MPKSPIPQTTGGTELPYCTIENIALETWPGFYLCGNLYRPKYGKALFPAILKAHGHWPDGRLHREADVASVSPDEPPAPGRADLVALAANLARQGFLVFSYDMVGFNDTRQIDHKFAEDRSERVNERNSRAGLPEAWQWGISLCGLQLWNSLRVLDFLESLPDVDAGRLGMTGASGGGSQTFLLAAVDERLAAAVPVNMVSAQMQGGCVCENGPGLRLGTDNVEIAALMAPRPQRLIACTGDWTKDNLQQEGPALRTLYELYGANERVDVCQFNYEHNYNRESREAMYAWFGHWLLNDSDPDHFREQPVEVDVAALRVWNDDNPLPLNAVTEPQLIAALIAQARDQLKALWPDDAEKLHNFRAIFTPALRHALGQHLPPPIPFPTIENWPSSRVERASQAALIVADATSRPTAEELARRLDEAGHDVWTLYLPNVEAASQKWCDNGFFATYNRTPLGDGVSIVATALQELYQRMAVSHLNVVGCGEAGLPLLLACAVASLNDSIERRIIVDAGQIEDSDDCFAATRLYAPGLRRAGDFRSAAILTTPAPLCLHNAGTARFWDDVAHTARIFQTELHLEEQPLEPQAIVEWLLDVA